MSIYQKMSVLARPHSFNSIFALLTLLFAVSISVKAEDTNLPADNSCGQEDGEVYLQVQVSKIKTNEGNIRVQLYGSKEDDFLAKGKKLLRIEVPSAEESRDICVKLPTAGQYALVVLHDRNGNGKADFFTEGFGFSRNPKLGLGAPDFDKVVFSADAGVQVMPITLKYLWNKDKKKTERRRRLRRRD